MTVEDIVEYTKYSELAQLGVIKRLTDPATEEDALKQIVSYINLGLIELYKRFSLRVEETVVTLDEGQTIYTLSSANIYHISNNPTGYLSDLPGDFNHVMACYNEAGHSYSINQEDDSLSVLTPSWNTIQVPNPITNEGLFVIYSSGPDKLSWITDVQTTYALDVPLPPMLLEALGHYIGYRGHGATNGSIQAENNTHYMRFDKSCKMAKEIGVVAPDTLIFRQTLTEKGFV